jgi:hypothetical protein
MTFLSFISTKGRGCYGFLFWKVYSIYKKQQHAQWTVVKEKADDFTLQFGENKQPQKCTSCGEGQWIQTDMLWKWCRPNVNDHQLWGQQNPIITAEMQCPTSRVKLWSAVTPSLLVNASVHLDNMQEKWTRLVSFTCKHYNAAGSFYIIKIKQ